MKLVKHVGRKGQVEKKNLKNFAIIFKLHVF